MVLVFGLGGSTECLPVSMWWLSLLRTIVTPSIKWIDEEAEAYHPVHTCSADATSGHVLAFYGFPTVGEFTTLAQHSPIRISWPGGRAHCPRTR